MTNRRHVKDKNSVKNTLSRLDMWVLDARRLRKALTRRNGITTPIGCSVGALVEGLTCV